MLTYHRSALGAIIELDSANGQQPDPSWTTISYETYATKLAELEAVRPAMRAKSQAASQAAYVDLIHLGVSPETAKLLTGHTP